MEQNLIQSESEVVGYSHDVHVSIVPVGMSYQVSHYCNSQDSQLAVGISYPFSGFLSFLLQIAAFTDYQWVFLPGSHLWTYTPQDRKILQFFRIILWKLWTWWCWLLEASSCTGWSSHMLAVLLYHPSSFSAPILTCSLYFSIPARKPLGLRLKKNLSKWIFPFSWIMSRFFS